MIDEFYEHPMMADGHLGKCKKCARRDVRENRERKHDYYIAYDRGRVAGKIEGVKQSIARHPQKHLARRAVHVAVANGSLERKPCEVCAVEKVEGHHDDYDKPLEVRWLCRRHHGELHRIDV